MVFLDVAKAFETVWVDVLLYKLTVLNFPSHLVKTISSYLHVLTFEASFKTATSTRRGVRAGRPVQLFGEPIIGPTQPVIWG